MNAKPSANSHNGSAPPKETDSAVTALPSTIIEGGAAASALDGDVIPSNITKIPRGRPFEKGHSGNIRGKPPGARNKSRLLAEALLDGQVEELTAKVIERALAGDMTALSLCMKLIFPSGRKRRVEIDLPPLVTAADGLNAITRIVAAAARGEISADEALQFVNLVELHRRSLEHVDIEERLKKLETAKGLI